jgi:serine/threonine protein kinase
MLAFSKALSGPGIDGWRSVGAKFASDTSVAVQRVKHDDGRCGVLKASEEFPGRVRCEMVYIEEATRHAQALFGCVDMFPAVLQRQRTWNGTKTCYFVMEDGGNTLAEFVGGSALPLGQVARLAMPLIRALQAMHYSVESPDMQTEVGRTHNDVKPTNVLVGQDGRVMLIDLDVAALNTPKPGNKYPTPGSYFWSGADALTGRYPTPKDDLDALGQVLLWTATAGTIWTTPAPKNPKDERWRAALAAEKSRWRAMNWTQRAAYMKLAPQYVDCFKRYFAIVENLGSAATAGDYDALCKVWSTVADGALNLDRSLVDQPGQTAKVQRSRAVRVTPAKRPREQLKEEEDGDDAAAPLEDLSPVKGGSGRRSRSRAATPKPARTKKPRKDVVGDRDVEERQVRRRTSKKKTPQKKKAASSVSPASTGRRKNPPRRAAPKNLAL